MPITSSNTSGQFPENTDVSVYAQQKPEPEEEEKGHPQKQRDTAQQQPDNEEYVTGGEHPATRPEQGADVAPDEQTVGIP